MASIIMLIALFVLGICHVTVADNGTIGFGLTMYQGLCCQACHDSLSSLCLSYTTFKNDDEISMKVSMSTGMAMKVMISDQYYATNMPWLQTMAYCIKQNCDADGCSAEKQAKCFSSQSVAGDLNPTFQDSLSALVPVAKLVEDAIWRNVTSLVNKNMHYATRLARLFRAVYYSRLDHSMRIVEKIPPGCDIM